MTLPRGEIRDIARVVHAANWAYDISLNDPAPDPPLLDILPEAQQERIMHRVDLILEGFGPEAIHEEWVNEMLARGWELGDVKNPTANPPTHPCLRDWQLCPPEQQVKDTMAISIVRNLAGVKRKECPSCGLLIEEYEMACSAGCMRIYRFAEINSGRPDPMNS